MKGSKFIWFTLIIIITLAAIGFTSPNLMSKIRLGLDLKGGFEILYEASPIDAKSAVTHDSLIQTAKSLIKRVDANGVSEPAITTEGSNRIRVQIAGVADQTAMRKLLSKPSVLSFRDYKGNILLNGSDFVPEGAKVEYQNNTEPIVSIKMKNKNLFNEVTTKIAAIAKPNNTLGIYLDDQPISAPSVNEAINSDSAIITGEPFTYLEAKNLVDTINLGALPLKLSEIYTQSVEATLGSQSLKDTLNAGLIAFILILVGMMIFYRVPGMIACFTLITYTWMLLLVFWLLNATLTLPGIAAFVLGVGMAVDANIITYERIKEEIRSGKSILSSLRAGSKTSFRTIIDAHVTTLTAAVVLYFVGNGSIQGFALTLIFSILVSLLTNVFLSRVLLQLLIRSEAIKKPMYFGVKEAEINAL